MMPQYKSIDEKNKYFLDNNCIDSADEFDKFYESIKGRNCVYRGVSNALYKIYSSLQRKWENKDELIEKFRRTSDAIKEFESIKNIIKNEISLNNRLSIDDQTNMAEFFTVEKILIRKIMADELVMPHLKGDGIEFNVMALLQHYGLPSMLIDFSYDPRVSLHFMTLNERREGYSSLYFIETDGNPFMNGCTLEQINADALEKIESICDTYGRDVVADELKKTKDLPLEQFFPSGQECDVKYVVVQGGVNNSVIAESTKIGVRYEFRITNPRMDKQKGLFVLNTTMDKPLEALFLDHHYKFIHCVNINNTLANYIREKYLTGISEDSIDFPNDESRVIYNRIEEIKAINGL